MHLSIFWTLEPWGGVITLQGRGGVNPSPGIGERGMQAEGLHALRLQSNNFQNKSDDFPSQFPASRPWKSSDLFRKLFDLIWKLSDLFRKSFKQGPQVGPKLPQDEAQVGQDDGQDSKTSNKTLVLQGFCALWQTYACRRAIFGHANNLRNKSDNFQIKSNNFQNKSDDFLSLLRGPGSHLTYFGSYLT